MRRLSVFLLILLTLNSGVYACRWCFDNRVSTLINSTLKQSVIPDSVKDQGDGGRVQDDDKPVIPDLVQDPGTESNDKDSSPTKRPKPTNQQQISKIEKEIANDSLDADLDLEKLGCTYKPSDNQGKQFYLDAVLEHYPKAFVLRYIYFPTMCPIAIDKALHEIVRLLTFDDWLFFGNKKQGFRWGAHWERIITICKIMNNFLNRCHVDLDSLLTFEKSYKKGFVMPSANAVRLTILWQEKGYTAFHDFYALYFDYVIKLFNEGIKFGDRRKVNANYYTLLSLVAKLKRSVRHQAKYSNAITRVKRLRTLFLEKNKAKRAS